MPSSLALQGYRLHQQINNIQLPGFPIRWCHLKRKWEIDRTKDYKAANKYLLKTDVVKVILVIFCFYSISLAFKYPRIFQIEHRFVPLMCIQIISSSVIADLLFVVVGTEMVSCCNWRYHTEILWLRRVIDHQFRVSFSHVQTYDKSVKIAISKQKGKCIINLHAHQN